MRTFRSGEIAIPLTLLLAGVVLTLDNFDVTHLAQVWNVWPVTLIAFGLEQIYFWAFPERTRRNRQ